MSLENFAKVLLRRFGSDASVPEWPNSDYETYYVFRIDWQAQQLVEFAVRSQALGELPDRCPGAVGD